METYMWIIWLGILIVSIIIEAVSADLISIFFAFGSLIALILSFIPGIPFYFEIIAFFLVSAITLLLVRPLTKKYLRKSISSSNVDSMVGERVLVSERIDSLHHGVVTHNDIKWTAIGLDDKVTLKPGEYAIIKAIKGNKVLVEADTSSAAQSEESSENQ
ncbi:MAG: NfeD family protein [Bacilli bacterium]|nr:NfeD family protein [Bacilli bacterium]